MAQPPVNPSWIAPHLSHQYPAQPVPQQARPQRASTTNSVQTFKEPPWYCDDCGKQFSDVFDASNHQGQTSHPNIKQLTKCEDLTMQEEKKKAELEELRRAVASRENKPVLPPGLEGVIHASTMVAKFKIPGPVGYQGRLGERTVSGNIPTISMDNKPAQPMTCSTYTPKYSPSTIPGLGPVSTYQPSTAADEVMELRRQKDLLHKQLNMFKFEVLTRLDALEAEIKAIKSDSKMRELKMSILAKQRDDAKAQLEILRNGNASAFLTTAGVNAIEQANGEEEPHWET